MTDTAIDSPAPRARLLQQGLRFAFPIPDALMAVILAATAVMDFLTVEQLAAMPPAFLGMREQLVFLLIVEGGFLMMQGTLVDIATRLKKRPPVWLAAIIVAGVAIFSSQSLDVLRMAWQMGAVAFIPLIVSLAERGTVLWRMPGRSRIQKIAARALIANRIITGLVLFGLCTLLMLVGVAIPRFYDLFSGSTPALVAGAIYFAVAAYDDYRVRGRRFAEKPRVLFRYDAIGIDYLAPV